MSTDVNSFIDKIVADAEKKIRTDLKNVSTKVKKDFVNKAQETVSLYYANYSPKVYQRTNNLRDHVIDDDLSFAILNASGYGGWVQFNSAQMSDYPRGSKEAVVSNFMYGIHGKKTIAVEDEPAINLMNDFQNNYKQILDGYFMNLGYTVK